MRGRMNNKLLIIIIIALLMGSGLLAADNSGAIESFCKNLVGEAVELAEVYGPFEVPEP